MFHLIRSELLKMRHTFALKLFIVAPVVTLGLGYFLSGKFVQLTAYNWWYTLILPITIAIWCASVISCEKRTQYQNIFCLPISMKKVWLSKLLAVTVLLFLTSLIMWGGCTVFGIFTVMNIDPLNGLTGCMLLFFAYIWQLPLIMWLTKKANYLVGVLLSFGCNVVLSMIGAESNLFYINPFAIPARIVCPFFKMHPNGLPVENGSFLLNTRPIIPAVGISLVLAILCFLLTAWLFDKGEREHE